MLYKGMCLLDLYLCNYYIIFSHFLNKHDNCGLHVCKICLFVQHILHKSRTLSFRKVPPYFISSKFMSLFPVVLMFFDLARVSSSFLIASRSFWKSFYSCFQCLFHFFYRFFYIVNVYNVLFICFLVYYLYYVFLCFIYMFHYFVSYCLTTMCVALIVFHCICVYSFL